MYHPDKNPSREAKAKFILIVKAYESLTDPVAFENYKKYGNPDGPGPMRLSVALPSFVLNKKNHMMILWLFLIFVVVLVPAAVLLWYNNSQRYDENGTRMDNNRRYFELLNQNTLLKYVPFALGYSIEFGELPIKDNETKELNTLYKEVADYMPNKSKSKKGGGGSFDSNKKFAILAYAYLQSILIQNERLKSDTERIVTLAPNLFHLMITMAYNIDQIARFQKGLKHFGFNCYKNIIETSQLIHHAIQ